MARAGGETPGLIQAVKVREGGGHGLSTRRVIKKGDIVFADLCGVYHRYHSNTSRTYVVGEPSSEMIDRWRKNAGAIELLCRIAKNGVSFREVNRVLLEYYKEAGLWELGGYALGYELGISFPPDWVGNFVLEIAEGGPLVTGLGEKSSDGALQGGMVTNWESLKGDGMIETLVYGADGARRQSKLPMEPIAVG
jgi:Xaa-Pro aminopeptidase